MGRPVDDQYRKAAKAIHETNDRACVIPEGAKVEQDPLHPTGAYVEARIWIDDTEAELEKVSTEGYQA